jgi:hypothetical protein
MPLKKLETRLWLRLRTYFTYLPYLTYAPVISLLGALKETRDPTLVMLTCIFNYLTLLTRL